MATSATGKLASFKVNSSLPANPSKETAATTLISMVHLAAEFKKIPSRLRQTSTSLGRLVENNSGLPAKEPLLCEVWLNVYSQRTPPLTCWKFEISLLWTNLTTLRSAQVETASAYKTSLMELRMAQFQSRSFRVFWAGEGTAVSNPPIQSAQIPSCLNGLLSQIPARRGCSSLS